MALLIPEGFGLLVHRHVLAGDPEEMVTTMGVTMGGSPSAVVQDSILRFQNAWPKANRSQDYVFKGVTLYVGQASGPPSVHESIVNDGGTATFQIPSSNCALLVKKQTALGGRRGRGRMYLPPFMLAEQDLNGRGELLPASIAAYQARVNTWQNGAGSVLLHDSEGKSAAPQPTPITSFVVDSRIATQRRRMRR